MKIESSPGDLSAAFADADAAVVLISTGIINRSVDTRCPDTIDLHLLHLQLFQSSPTLFFILKHGYLSFRKLVFHR
jgi:hypothetical protein